MASNRSRGTTFEYRVKASLEALGYLVQRSPLSLGPFDLKATNGLEVRLIQCKKWKRRPRLSLDEIEGLIQAKQLYCNSGYECKAELAYPTKDKSDLRKKPILYKEVTEHEYLERVRKRREKSTEQPAPGRSDPNSESLD